MLLHSAEKSRTDYRYFLGAVSRMGTFPVGNPGLHRFISTDQLNMEEIPQSVLEMVGKMKQWWVGLVAAAGGEELSSKDADRIANIILAYISGESTDIINGRILPDEDVQGRVVGNAITLFQVLTESCGANHTVLHNRRSRKRRFPVMRFIGEEK